jgi:hypothetical protein
MHAAPLRLAALATLLACAVAMNGGGGGNGGAPPPTPMQILEDANCHQPGINETESCHECHDGFDNDGDGAMDCADGDCVNHPFCQPEQDAQRACWRGGEEELIEEEAAVLVVLLREKQIGGSSGGSLEPPGPLLTHLHTIYIAYSERLPTRLNPLAERTCFLQVLLALLVAGGCTAHRCYKKRAAAGQAEFSNFEDGIDSIPPNRPTAKNGGGGGVP